MFIKLFSIVLLFAVTYTTAVFFTPEVADTYGNAELNAKIRLFKDDMLLFSSGATDTMSLYEKVKSKGESFVGQWIETYSGIQSKAEQIQATLSWKVDDAQKAIESAQKALDAIEAAKSDISNALNFSGSASTSASWSTNISQE